MTDTILATLNHLIQQCHLYEKGEQDYPPYTPADTLTAAKEEIEHLRDMLACCDPYPCNIS